MVTVVRTRAGSKAKQSKQAECRGRVWLAGWLVDLFLRGKEGENMGGGDEIASEWSSHNLIIEYIVFLSLASLQFT